MAAFKRFEEIIAWQKARVMVHEIYVICETGRISKDFGLKDQLTRAAISSMSNIAEGFGRGSDKEFVRFLDYSWASICEVQSLLYAILDNKWIPQETFDSLYKHADEVASMVAGLSAYLKKRT